MTQLKLDLAESELKLVLGALSVMEKQLVKSYELMAHDDDVSESAENLVEVRLLLNPLKERAVKKFGKGVLKHL